MLFTPLPCAYLLFLPGSASVSWCQLTQFQRKPALLRVLPACLRGARLAAGSQPFPLSCSERVAARGHL